MIGTTAPDGGASGGPAGLRARLRAMLTALPEAVMALRIPPAAKGALQAGFLLLAAWYLYRIFAGNADAFLARMGGISWTWLVAAWAVVLLLAAMNAYILKVAVGARGHGIRFSSSFWISSVANLHSLLLPFQAGLGTRAVYLNRHASLGYGEYARMTLGLLLLLLLAAAWTGAMVVLLPSSVPRAALAVGITVLAGAAVLATRIPMGPALAGLFVADILLSAFRFFLLYAANGDAPGFRECVVIACLTVLVPLLAPVPGGLGVLESTILLGGRMTHLPDDASLAVALLNRVSGTLAAVLLGLVGQFLVHHEAPDEA